MSRNKLVKRGWYHNWSLHCDVTFAVFEVGEEPDLDWYGPFKLYSQCKKDALEKALWERQTANYQIRQIKQIRRPF